MLLPFPVEYIVSQGTLVMEQCRLREDSSGRMGSPVLPYCWVWPYGHDMEATLQLFHSVAVYLGLRRAVVCLMVGAARKRG